MKTLLSQLVAGRPLSRSQAVDAFERIMTGQATPAQIAALLAMIESRGPTTDEIVGAATVMRRKVVPVSVPAGLRVMDTCGTGGTHSRTLNISTTAALVVAAVGRPHNLAVAKHGNRSVTSASGSSQVLEALGLRLAVPADTLTRCLAEAGFCFCFAPAHHPAMKFAVPVRAELGFRTLFNLLGPLTNPAGACRQVMGVFDASLTEPVACVLAELGCEAALVVHGRLGAADDPEAPGLGELSTAGPTRITRLAGGRIDTREFNPADVGLPTVDAAALMVDSPQASAALVRDVLAGKPGPARDIVALNAAAALWVADLARDLHDGLDQARAALDDGRAQAVLRKVIDIAAAAPAT